jgi:hypothetical protein
MKTAIIGSRGFTDYNFFSKVIDVYREDISLIISGGARGTDKMAEQYADEHNIPKRILKPDWDWFGKKAGMIRNQDIIKGSEFVIAFWDGTSKGTENAITLAKRFKKQLEIYRI